MIPLAVDEIVALRLGRLDGAADGGTVTRVTADSRDAGPGDLFVALNAGVDYVEEARARGAATLVPDDQEAALAALASLVRSKSDARVVAVVGSAGKTTTKDILGALCAPHAPTVWAERSLNNEVGLPLTVLRLEPDTRILVTEMGMRGIGQIAALCAIAKPDVTVVPHIGPEHLELLGSVERVAEANAEAIAALPRGGTAVVPADSAELEPYLTRDDVHVRRFAPDDVDAATGSPGSAWTARSSSSSSPSRSAISQRTRSRRCMRTPRSGSRSTAPTRESPRSASLRWRGEETPLPGGGFVVNDAYNANPSSLRAALEHLAERAGPTAALGDPGRDGRARRDGSAVPPRARRASPGARDRGRSAWGRRRGLRARRVGRDAGAEAIAIARERIAPGDAVLVKASRAVGLEGIADEITNFARAWSPS